MFQNCLGTEAHLALEVDILTDEAAQKKSDEARLKMKEVEVAAAKQRADESAAQKMKAQAAAKRKDEAAKKAEEDSAARKLSFSPEDPLAFLRNALLHHGPVGTRVLRSRLGAHAVDVLQLALAALDYRPDVKKKFGLLVDFASKHNLVKQSKENGNEYVELVTVAPEAWAVGGRTASTNTYPLASLRSALLQFGPAGTCVNLVSFVSHYCRDQEKLKQDAISLSLRNYKLRTILEHASTRNLIVVWHEGEVGRQIEYIKMLTAAPEDWSCSTISPSAAATSVTSGSALAAAVPTFAIPPRPYSPPPKLPLSSSPPPASASVARTPAVAASAPSISVLQAAENVKNALDIFAAAIKQNADNNSQFSALLAPMLAGFISSALPTTVIPSAAIGSGAPGNSPATPPPVVALVPDGSVSTAAFPPAAP